MQRHMRAAMIVAPLSVLSFALRFADAHGYVGQRLFPATITTEDPTVSDELAFPGLTLYTFPAGEEGPETRAFAAGFEFSKVVLPKLAIGVEQSYVWLHPRGEAHASGWENLSLSLKYELWRSDEHEAVLSIGLETEFGGTGSKSIGREPFTVFVPTIYFGKGFGDLPETLALLRPFAVTATIGQTIPTEAVPNTLEWGISLQYNIPYLQQHVKDFGVPEPFRNMIPLVEFSMETAENRGPLGVTMGTINPGVLWETRYVQIGIEALIPVNRASGDHVGVMISFEIYIDDLFPDYFGHSLFGD